MIVDSSSSLLPNKYMLITMTTSYHTDDDLLYDMIDKQHVCCSSTVLQTKNYKLQDFSDDFHQMKPKPQLLMVTGTA